MKSLRSCLLALIVLVLIAAGGYWVYQQAAPGGGRSLILSSRSAQPQLTLKNGTTFGLTITLRGAKEERFDLAPGQKATKEIAPGEYQVEGRVSDPSTDPFTATWTFEAGGKYDAGFSRSGGTGQLIALIDGSP